MAKALKALVLWQNESWKYFEITIEFSEVAKYAQQDVFSGS